MKIAIVQMEIAQGEPSLNLKKMERFIALARKKKTDIIVFPEYSITGSVRKRPDLIDKKGDYRKYFSNLARVNNIDIVCGSFIEMENGRAYNTSCYFDRSGKVLASYRKINLWHSERGRLARGKELSVFDTRFGKAGLAICWDLTNPSFFRTMAEKGAKIIFVPSFWSDAGISNSIYEARNIDTLCHVRSFENECVIVYVNAAGIYSKGDNLIGHSQVTLPPTGVLKKLAHNRESIMHVKLDLKRLEKAAKIYKIRSDMENGY